MVVFLYIYCSEQLFRTMADLLVSEGYADVGYEYVNVDDCWLEKSRDPVTKKLIEDRERFPNGMKSLGQYVNIFYMLALVCFKS